jgi:FRG domain-containing protein
MEEIRVASWAELQEQLLSGSWNEELGLHRSNDAYRGRGDATDDLSTKLLRLDGDAATLERNLLRNFRKYAPGDAVPDDPPWNWLALGQHHGLPTRLLDWTYSPYVAELKWEARDKLDQANVTERVLFPAWTG